MHIFRVKGLDYLRQWVCLCLQAIKYQSGKLADCIAATYGPWLKCDPELQAAAHAVTSSYLLSKQASGGGGLLGDLFQMLGAG